MTTKVMDRDAPMEMRLASLEPTHETAPDLRFKWMEFDEASIGIGVGSSTSLQPTTLPQTASGASPKRLKGVIDYRIAF